MSVPTVGALLERYHETDVTPRLVWGIFEVIPGAPAVSYYRTLEEARMLVRPELDDAGLARAQAWAAGPEVAAALKVADAIDTGDMGISVFSGLKSAYSFFFGDKQKALDTDPQQGADAALKALAIAWLAWRLFPGTVTEKIAKLRSLPAGEALLTWFAAVEIALPFTDDALLEAGSIVSALMRKYGGSLSKLEMFAGPGAVTNASGVLGELTQPLDEVVRSVAAHSAKIATAAQRYLPQAIATAGTVAGAAATAADALPVYRFLVARLCAEAALQRAADGTV